MPAAPHPRMHGLTHVPGGPDPIPGLILRAASSYDEAVLFEPTLVGYWPLEDDGPIAVDLSTNGRNLTETDVPPEWQAPGPFVTSGNPDSKAVGFDATSGTLTDTDALEDVNTGAAPWMFDGVAPYCFEIIVYPTALPTLNPDGIMSVFGYPGGSIDGISMLFTETGHVRITRANLSWDSTDTLNMETWTHVAMTYDGATVKLFFDGEVEVSAATVATHASSGHLKVGSIAPAVGSGDFRGNFKGRLGQAAIYNDALEQTTIADHANYLAPTDLYFNGKLVSEGPPDSGGTGYRLLRIPN